MKAELLDVTDGVDRLIITSLVEVKYAGLDKASAELQGHWPESMGRWQEEGVENREAVWWPLAAQRHEQRCLWTLECIQGAEQEREPAPEER